MATVVKRAIYSNIGGGSRRVTSLYDNVGGSRKTISSAYCNIGGSRKQIHPYYTVTEYAYKRHTVNSWTKKSMSGAGGIYDFSGLSSLYTSYSFNSSTGKFTLSGSATPSEYNDYGDAYFSSPVYYKLNDRLIVATETIQICHGCGCENIPISAAYYAYPNGYSSSYTTVTYTYSRSTGYSYSYYSSYDDCPSCTDASSKEVLPIYSNYYYENA